MTSPRFLVSVMLAWFAFSTALPAWAARVAALAPRFEPPAGSELRERFHDAMSRGLQQGGAEVVPAAEVRGRLAANEALAGCTGGACVAPVLGELRADRLAMAEITVSGKNYTVTLRLLDRGGAEVWRATERCDICTVREADETVVKVAARMAPWVARPGPTEQAAAERPAPPPVAAPAPAPPPPKMPLAPIPPPSEPRRWTPYRYAWVAALATGGAFLVASMPFLVYSAREGQTTCDPSVPVRRCPTVYRGNLGAGLGLLLGGAVGVGGGSFALFYYLDQQAQKRRTPRAALLPMAGGALLGLEGSF